MVARILNFDFKSLNNDPSKENLASLKKFTPFLDNAVPYLATLKPGKNSNGKYSFEGLYEMILDGRDYEVLGDKVNSRTIGGMMGLLGKANRSDYSTIKQGENPKYSCGTPWFLYAHKINNDIAYEDWDWSEDSANAIIMQKFALGKFLSPILDYRDFKIDASLEEQLLDLRDTALTVKATNAKCSDLGNKLSTSGSDLDQVPKALQYMIFQTWVWSPKLRSKYMITDWNNYDNLRPSILGDSVFSSKETKAAGDFIL